MLVDLNGKVLPLALSEAKKLALLNDFSLNAGFGVDDQEVEWWFWCFTWYCVGVRPEAGADNGTVPIDGESSASEARGCFGEGNAEDVASEERAKGDGEGDVKPDRWDGGGNDD